MGIQELNISIEMWCVAFCTVGIVCTAIMLRSEPRYRNYIVIMFALGLLMAGADAVAYVFRGGEGLLASVGTHGGNFVSYCAGFLNYAAISAYMCQRIEDSMALRSENAVPVTFAAATPNARALAIRDASATAARNAPASALRNAPGGRAAQGFGLFDELQALHAWRTVALALALVFCVLTALGVFYYIDADNLYHRSGFYWMSALYLVVVSIVNLVLVVRARKLLTGGFFACMLFYCIVPPSAYALQFYGTGLNFGVIVSALGLLVLFIEAHLHLSRELERRTEQLVRANQAAAEARVAVMASQIQPHFLFNTLDSIYYLVEVDPTQALPVIDKFASYLRTNLNSLNLTQPVPIETELSHVRVYLDLEKASKEDLLEYSIENRGGGFSVPALSVQTLVENAVRHGVGKRPGGGRVDVRVASRPGWHTVTVTDDGVGFDAEEPPGEGRHLGIENTRSRLASMCSGELDLASEPGRGTIAVIRIPEAREEAPARPTGRSRP